MSKTHTPGPWVEQTIQIATRLGMANVVAKVSGAFAVHYDLDGRGNFVLTHVPSGTSLYQDYTSEGEAFAVRDAIVDLADWPNFRVVEETAEFRMSVRRVVDAVRASHPDHVRGAA